MLNRYWQGFVQAQPACLLVFCPSLHPPVFPPLLSFFLCSNKSTGMAWPRALLLRAPGNLEEQPVGRRREGASLGSVDNRAAKGPIFLLVPGVCVCGGWHNTSSRLLFYIEFYKMRSRPGLLYLSCKVDSHSITCQCLPVSVSHWLCDLKQLA